MKRTSPKIVTDKAFKQYIEFVNLYELRPEVWRRINEKVPTGEEVPRVDVHRWLHLDPNKRIEPRWGIGSILLEVWQDILKDYVDKRRSQGWDWTPADKQGVVYLVPPPNWPNRKQKTFWLLLDDTRRVPHWIGDEP